MKILHAVEFYHPKGGGMYEVVRQLSERLVKFGHDITVATKRLPQEDKRDFKGVKTKEFDLYGNLVVGIKGERKKYEEFLINSDFDIIVAFAAQQPLVDVMLPILDKIKPKKVFVPTGFSALYIKEFKNYFEQMKNWMKKFDINVFLSNDYRDINFARKNRITNIIVIPNGADEKEFLNKSNIDIRKKLKIPRNHFLILHVGAHTNLKGHYEAIEIFSKARIKNTTFLLIGYGRGGCYSFCKAKEIKLNNSRNFKLYNKKLLVRVLNRENTIAAYQEADLFLFPSNTECSPIVLFESMASKTPFLVTDVGNAAEIIKWSNGGMLLPTKKGIDLNIPFLIKLKRIIKKILKFFGKPYSEINLKFAEAEIKGSVKLLEDLFNNSEKRKELAEAGYKSWLEKFTWKKIAKDYENLYKSLI